MNCKTCDYPLWNLTNRQCPECGTPFKPSEFEFVINSVRFCCPHCDQSYYGTDYRGHLVPYQFACVKCGQQIEMDAMVLRPAEGVSEQQTSINRMPWLERAHRPWFKRFFLTVFGSMFNPGRLMRATPTEGTTGAAWMFALQCTLVFLFLGLGFPFAVIGLIDLLSGGGQSAAHFGIAAGAVVGGTIALMVITALWGLIAHGLLRISGGVTEPLGRTMQAFCFSCGTLVLVGLPCVGMYCSSIGAIWWVISATLMLADAQKVHGGRAAFAVITPALTVVLAAGGLMFAGIIASMNSPRMFTATGGVSSQFDTRFMAQSILQYAAANNGQPPRHAAQLLIDNAMSADMFMNEQTSTVASDVTVADTTLDRFERLPPNRQQLAATAAANALPSGVIAHRLGDFVFTYHGIDLGNPDPGLWIVVFLPEQGPAGVPVVTRPVVGLADGSSQQVTGSFAAELAVQNSLRATHELPALPDLATVKHDAPALAGKGNPTDSGTVDEG